MENGSETKDNEAKKALQTVRDLKLMSEEKYEINGYERHFEELKKEWFADSERPGSLLRGLNVSMGDYCEAFGKLLQAEMKKHNGLMTEEMVKDVGIRAGNFGLKYGNQFNLVGWIHSDKLQQFEDYRDPLFDVKRITWHDKAYKVYDKYKDRIGQTDGEKRKEEMASMLAEVFCNSNGELEQFYKNFSDPDKFKAYDVNFVCPGFKVADNLKWTDFAFACTKAYDLIRERQSVRKKVLEKAGPKQPCNK